MLHMVMLACNVYEIVSFYLDFAHDLGAYENYKSSLSRFTTKSSRYN